MDLRCISRNGNYISIINIIMFKRDRQFNIISGQATNYASQRSLSYATQRQAFQNQPLPAYQTSKLGAPRDRKMYVYHYQPVENHPNARAMTENNKGNPTPPSLLNYVSTNYNIITHHDQHPTSKIVTSDAFKQKLPQVNRKSPLTAIIHAGRLVAPNYHKGYAQRQAKKEFMHKRGGLCDGVCEVQKGYSMGRYFRKFK